MYADRLHLDSLELRAAADQIQGSRKVATDTGTAVSGVSIDYPPDDPLRTHYHFVKALTAFTTAWGRELEYLGEAAGDLVTGLNKAATDLLRKDGQNAVDTKNATGAR